MKIHFDAQGKGRNGIPGYPECGESYNIDATTDPSKVTCERCRKTKAYKEALNDT